VPVNPSPAVDSSGLSDAEPHLSWLILALMVGGAVGLAITWTAPDRGTEAWVAWTAIAVALTAAAGVAALNGVMCWRVLKTLHPITLRDVGPTVVALTLVPVVVVVASLTVASSGSSVRGASLIGVAILGSIPTLVAMASIRLVAGAEPLPGALHRIDVLLISRLLLQRLLWGLGALVALSTLALGVSLRLRAPALSDTDLGQQRTLVLGAIGSAIMALAYVPVATSLRGEVREEARHLFPFADGDDGDTVIARLQNRSEIEKLVGGERGVFDELVTSLVILGPILTTAIGSYITG